MKGARLRRESRKMTPLRPFGAERLGEVGSRRQRDVNDAFYGREGVFMALARSAGETPPHPSLSAPEGRRGVFEIAV
jgi:hypothetical protein